MTTRKLGLEKVRKMNEPRSPTFEERISHGYLHLPYRSWCEHCVKGKGKEAPHRQGGDQPEIPEFHADFMFMGGEEGGGTLTILVVKERLSRAVMATMVPSKSTGEFVGKRVLAFMRELGCDGW